MKKLMFIFWLLTLFVAGCSLDITSNAVYNDYDTEEVELVIEEETSGLDDIIVSISPSYIEVERGESDVVRLVIDNYGVAQDIYLKTNNGLLFPDTMESVSNTYTLGENKGLTMSLLIDTNNFEGVSYIGSDLEVCNEEECRTYTGVAMEIF
jgi:hypothetical protein